MMKEALEKEVKFREAKHLQTLESNPLDARDIAMFEMFGREGFSPEQRRAYILKQAQEDAPIPAAH
ncbi:MAG: hypothetical protein AAFR71_09895 [Pseudomonadota bacterium]